MSATQKDYSILGKFGFEVPPIGIKFLARPPNNIPRLAENMTLCEMFRHAQQGNVFYAAREQHTCDAGKYILGQSDLAGPYINGEFGAGLGVFDSPRSGSRLYLNIRTIPRGAVSYVALAPWDKLPFDPDVLLIIASTSQAEIIMR